MAKKWTSCISCDYQSECDVCKARFEGYDKKSVAAEDIGCFNFEIIKKQRKARQEKQQLKLFRI